MSLKRIFDCALLWFFNASVGVEYEDIDEKQYLLKHLRMAHIVEPLTELLVLAKFKEDCIEK